MQIELTVDQVDEVLIAELQREYRLDMAAPKHLKAIRRVLKYYMEPAEYEAFMKPLVPVEPMEDADWDTSPLVSVRSFQVGDVVRVGQTRWCRAPVGFVGAIARRGDTDYLPFWIYGEDGDEYPFDGDELTLIRRAA